MRRAYLTLESELGECVYWLNEAQETCTDILMYGIVLDHARAAQAAKLVYVAYENVKEASDILWPDFRADQAKGSD